MAYLPHIHIITADENMFKRDKYNKYNLMYFEFGQQVWIFTTSIEQISINLHGIFSIAGCKGYPELLFQGDQSLPDFFPDFKDTWLKSQRYDEQNVIPADELSVRNAISFFSYYDILRKTPGIFRLSYPHQFTLIDLIALLIQYLLMYALGVNTTAFGHRRLLKVPLGTLLPYFKEDSNHAYVIVPGFYKTVKGENSDEQTFVQRTGSDVMQLIEDIIALFNKVHGKVC